MLVKQGCDRRMTEQSAQHSSVCEGSLPLVSVVLPAYNAAPLIARTLKSILSQTYCHLEVLVVDDGSTDETAAIVQAVAAGDRRVKLLHQPNAGVAAARNLAIRQAQGEFIAPIDADDLWHPDHLQRQTACFLSAPAAVGVVYSWSIDIDADDRPLPGFNAALIEGNVYTTLLCHNFLGNASCSMIRASSLNAVGGYNSDFRLQQAQGCEDWDLYLRLAACYEFRAVPAFLVGYRKISCSMSRDYAAMARSQALMLQAAQPAVPAFLHRLSRSSFYLYLARQCSLSGDRRGTQIWLKEAVRADRLTPLLRPGFYLMAVESWRRNDRSAATVASPPASPASISQVPSWLSLFLKLLVGRSFHCVMQWFTSSSSQAASGSSELGTARSRDCLIDQR